MKKPISSSPSSTAILVAVVGLLLTSESSCAYTPQQQKRHQQQHQQPQLSRRSFGGWVAITAVTGINSAGFLLGGGVDISHQSSPVSPPAAMAFDGSGSSAYSGRSPATKLALRKSYQERVAADVRDFNALGSAILDRGELVDSDAWVFFFTTMQRNQMDEAGRTYAALVDLRGSPTAKKGVYEGGDGFLLANTFTKQGKPPDNTPAVKSFNALAKLFDPIQAAGEKKDLAAAKAAYGKASVAFSQYLSDVEMPASLDDPLYK